jgi:hypothetical protein
MIGARAAKEKIEVEIGVSKRATRERFSAAAGVSPPALTRRLR